MFDIFYTLTFLHKNIPKYEILKSTFFNWPYTNKYEAEKNIRNTLMFILNLMFECFFYRSMYLIQRIPSFPKMFLLFIYLLKFT